MTNVALTASTELAIVPVLNAARVGAFVGPDGTVTQFYLVEAHKSREIRNDANNFELTRVFYVHGTDDPSQCADMGPQIGDADDVLRGLIAVSRRMSPHASGGGEASVVRIEITYRQPDAQSGPGTVADTNFSYEVGGETEHIEVALSQTAYPSQSDKIDANLIGYDGETINGVDINAPILEFTEEYTFTEAQFNPFYRKLLYIMAWSVNAGPFREYAAGEVQFAGASAVKRAGYWQVSFRFRVRRNVEISVPTISGTQAVIKQGWQYLWYQYAPIQGSSSSDPVKQVVEAAYVATVYKSSDFSVLGIGTAARA